MRHGNASALVAAGAPATLRPGPGVGARGVLDFGSIDSYRSALVSFPAEKLTVVYCGNGISRDYTVNDLLLGVLAIYYNKPYRLPDFTGPTLQAADLLPFASHYASTQVPLKISVSAAGTTLMAQATGQAAFALLPVTKTKFTYAATGLTIDFDPAAHTFMLRQGANNLLFTRE